MREVRPLRAYAEVVLGRQRSPQHDGGPHMVPYLRAANVKDGFLDLSDVKDMNFTPDEQRAFQLAPGDVLVTEGSGSLRAVGASAIWNADLPGVICFQNTLLRLRPRPSTDPLFLAWWCRFAFADGLFAGVATGANIFHVSAERVRSLPMTHLSLPDQRAIAAFLDRETTRIDALITAKRRMIEVLEERAELAVSAVLLNLRDGERRDPADVPLASEVPGGWETPALGTLLSRITYGFTNPMPSTDEGPLLLTANDIGDGSVSVSTCRRTSPEAFHGLLTDKSRPIKGDILLTKDGTLGRVAVHDGSPACINQSVALLRPRRLADAELIAELLRARPYREAMIFNAGGTTIKHLYISRVAKLRVAWPPEGQRQACLDRIRRVRNHYQDLLANLTRQIDLLVEHRQALITAAVTGELNVGVAA